MTFQVLLEDITSLISHHYKDSHERKQRYDQNIVQLTAFILVVFLYTVYTVTTALSYNVATSCALSFISTLALILAGFRASPQAFSVLVILFSISIPLIISDLQDDIFSSFLMNSLGPLLTLLLTNSSKCLTMSTLIHLVALNSKFRPQILSCLRFANNSDYDSILDKAFATISIQIVVFMMIQGTMNIALQESVGEVFQKNRNIEKLKINRFKVFDEICTQISNPLRRLYATVDFSLYQSLPAQVCTNLRLVQTFIKIFKNEMENILISEKMKFQPLEIRPLPTRTSDWIHEIWSVMSELIKDKKPLGFLKVQRRVPPLLYLDSRRIQQIILNLLQFSMEKTNKKLINVTIDWLDSEVISNTSFEPIPYNYEEEGLFEKKEGLHFLDTNNTEKSQDRYQVLKSLDKEIRFENSNCSRNVPFGTLKVTISDSSSGLNQTQINNLFNYDPDNMVEPLSEAKHLRRRALKVSNDICRKMGGELRVYSKEGVGTTFISCFPIPTYGFGADNQEAQEKVMKLRKKKVKVMIASNDLTFIYQTTTYLHSIEADIVSKTGGVNDFFTNYNDLCADTKKPVDIIIIDFKMSHPDLIGFCEKIRNHEKMFRVMPAYIVVTGDIKGDEMLNGLMRKSSDGSVNKYLKRSFEFCDFLEALIDFS